MLTQDELYMQRCIELAKLGAGNVAPNPMVGSVLVYENRIIGEGYHQQYGNAHAEVNCIASVRETDKHLIHKATLYVSLEPCAHYGKTPPCSDLIIRNKIPKVVIGCRDSFKEVDGRGIEKLKAANIQVVQDVLKDECIELNKRFFTFHRKLRPYIILKWAQTVDEKIGSNTDNRLLISNKFSNVMVHKWRSVEAGILVGTNTAAIDDPSLTNRRWTGKNSIRLILDKDLKLSQNLKIFNDNATPTIVFNFLKSNFNSETQLENQTYYFKINDKQNIAEQLSNACYQLNIQSILVEGGAILLQSFIDQNLYDEIRTITNQQLQINDGLNAPHSNSEFQKSINFKNDLIKFSYN